jgi:hypothetical protein
MKLEIKILSGALMHLFILASLEISIFCLLLSRRANAMSKLKYLLVCTRTPQSAHSLVARNYSTSLHLVLLHGERLGY